MQRLLSAHPRITYLRHRDRHVFMHAHGRIEASTIEELNRQVKREGVWLYRQHPRVAVALALAVLTICEELRRNEPGAAP